MIEAILMETPCRSKRTVPLFTLALQCETEPLPLPILTSVFVVLAGGCRCQEGNILIGLSEYLIKIFLLVSFNLGELGIGI